MDSKIIELKEWGCDIEAALDRMLNDEEFYLECLQSMSADDDFKKLCDELKSDNIQAAFETAHKLKGIIANLGLTPMYKKIVEIVEPLRAGKNDGLIEKYNELSEMRDKLINILG